LRNYKELEQFKVNFSCPICGDSKKVKWKARGYVYIYQGKTFFKCQNCGDSKSFSSFLRHVNETAWSEWRKESIHDEPSYSNLRLNTITSIKKNSYENMTRLSDLSDDHISHIYAKSRLLPNSRKSLLFYTNNFRNLVDEIFPGKGGRYPEDERLVLPIYNEKNELVGITGRSMSGSPIRYSTAKSNDQKCFFGLERLDKSKPVFVVEGPIDSLFLPNAIAVCHADLGMFANQYPDVKSILIFDNEPNNSQIIKNMEKALSTSAKICTWNNCPYPGKDINEMIQKGADIKTLLAFILNNSHSGQAARFELIRWRKGQ
jgi:predicted RNA-binding Zn-ribbon protein involved in translation (DUF1610 family)